MKNAYIYTLKNASVALFLFLAATASAQIKITAPAKDSFLIGEKIDLELEQPNTLNQLPQLPQNMVWVDTPKLNSAIKNFSFTVLDEGSFTFPQITFSNGQTSDSIQLKISLAQVDTTQDIKPIKAPFQVDYKENNYWWIWLLAAFAALILIWFLLRNKRKTQPQQEYNEALRSGINPYIEELEKMLEDEPWNKGQTVQAWLQLKDILRRYLHARFGIRTYERTTDQILRSATKHFSGTPYMQQLQNLLTEADAVAFAKYFPEPIETKLAVQNILAFVEKTQRPQENFTLKSAGNEQDIKK